MLLGTSLCFVQWLRLYLKKNIEKKSQNSPFWLESSSIWLPPVTDSPEPQETFRHQFPHPLSAAFASLFFVTELYLHGNQPLVLRNPSVPAVPSSPEKSGSPAYSVLGACELKTPEKLETGREKKKKSKSEHWICPYQLLFFPWFCRNQLVHIGICLSTHSKIHFLHNSA